jgi:hypothetical protein
LVANSADGSMHYVMDWRHAAEVLVVGEGRYTELKNIWIWTKTNGCRRLSPATEAHAVQAGTLGQSEGPA